MVSFVSSLPLQNSSLSSSTAKLTTSRRGNLYSSTVRRAAIRRAPVQAQQQLEHFTSVEDIPLDLIPLSAEQLPPNWSRPGVYGVYSSSNALQYVAAVRDVRAAVTNHIRYVKNRDLLHSVRMLTVDDLEHGEKLGQLAEKWVITHSDEGPGYPPGNTESAPEWRMERKPDDVYFTEGTPPSMVEGEIESILCENEIVLFMKGTRQMPRCGFSASVIGMMEQVTDEFVCVDCLDAEKNTGLRDGIKQFSKWPTIPQLYVNGEFVGGHDIVRDMMTNGEMQTMMEKVAAQRQ